MPRVSVVIPAYQNADFIAETMDSVLAQTYGDFEVVVADHSSTDGTWELLQPYGSDARVRLLRTPAGGGAERNWNRVTEEASGEFVKLVCGDDVLYPELLARQVAAFDAVPNGGFEGTTPRTARDAVSLGGTTPRTLPGADAEMTGPHIAMVATTRDIIDATGRPVVRDLGLAGLRGRVAGRAALRRSVLMGANIFGEPCCVLLRRSVLTAIGGWHGNPGFMIDQATYARALLHGDLIAVAGPLAAFRLSANQQSVGLAKQQARSAAEMHRQLAAMTPRLLSPADVRIGNAMAALRAVQRRLVYLWVGKRMRPVPSSGAE
jgi:glycosyltransferase involved in cell wall biosynthesis